MFCGESSGKVYAKDLKLFQKEGDHEKPNNYRPISLLPVLSKLCERIAFYYIHTEKYSPKSYVVNFRTQISSSQSEERTMVFTRAKMIRPIKIANDVFSRGRKTIRPIRSHRGV